jgi:hypothetical protein
MDMNKLNISDRFGAVEMVDGQGVRIDENNMMLTVPAGRTKVIRIEQQQ